MQWAVRLEKFLAVVVVAVVEKPCLNMPYPRIMLWVVLENFLELVRFAAGSSACRWRLHCSQLPRGRYS